MSYTVKGLLAMIGACVIWGLSSIYYKTLSHVPPLEVLSHRTLWSMVFFGLLLAFRGRLNEVVRLIGSRQVLLVALAAVMISTNWFFFIFSVQTGRALGASLGYYIFPLVAVLLGVVIFRERLGPVRGLAVAIAAVAVLILTLGLGAAPWISLTLAGTFGFYGVAKKGVVAGPVASVTAEVVLLAPLAILWLVGVHALGWEGIVGRNLGAFGTNWHDTLLLAFSGVLTGTPLILFSYAAKRLGYGLVGLLQYINPTLQFLVATFLFLEPVTRWHLIALPLIWLALALYSFVTLREERAASRVRARDATSAATLT
ncbi:EamA family transporter RarD [Maritimibacter sp. UBA3975]|uniref:EamA family transporter RarD n=1 Tax=Maritimibacter sp. UBA3975 TaxID=1946833 RepID=UPI000C0AC266|nr:EamA family transporter RarD [Maritimibacter sp. UBA3975]MAM61148.1 protein RarD [Maritimibacter sp.]